MLLLDKLAVFSWRPFKALCNFEDNINLVTLHDWRNVTIDPVTAKMCLAARFRKSPAS